MNEFRFSGKEVQPQAGLLDFGARLYDPRSASWLSPDPMAEKYYSVSPYAYCANDPLDLVDPEGKSTWVTYNTETGLFNVFGGNVFDNDHSIYLYLKDINGKDIRGPIIGQTAFLTSFYDSENLSWNGEINMSDDSGTKFLTSLFNETPDLFEYILNARNGKPYDFKVTNGYPISTEVAPNKNIDLYRGMPISSENGTLIYSARDIGNIGAGYIAGYYGLPWTAARAVFDLYQSYKSNRLMLEGPSTWNPEKYGWTIGHIVFNQQHHQKR